jgi:glycosyltransferase involved in cell wall biosynthesis
MQVSVVIPVYNAEKYVTEAVQSALSQAEAAEIILVEDGSEDRSLEVCKELTKKDARVKLFQQDGGYNRGAGASRNLGITKSNFEYIAFLDADDFYLPNRFEISAKLFQQAEVDAVYEAVGSHFEIPENESSVVQLTTVTKDLSHDMLFENIGPIGSCGGIHLDGLILRKSAFTKSGYFDENLQLHQDTALILRVAATCEMQPGRLKEPVAMRRVHENNRITAPRSDFEKFKMRLLFWETVHEWGSKHLSQSRQNLVAERTFAHIFTPCRITTSKWDRRKLLIQQITYAIKVFRDPEMRSRFRSWAKESVS